MYWQYTPYVIPVLIAALVSVVLAILSWRRHPAPGTGLFTILMLSLTWWSLGYAMELVSAELSGMILWAKAQYLGITTVPVLWLAMVLAYIDRRKWLRRNLAFLFIVPFITQVLVWTNEFHELIWVDVILDTGGAFLRMAFSRGVWYWVNVTYAYLMMLVATLLLVITVVRASRPYRGQITALLVGSMAPWAGNAAYMIGLAPAGLDLTPIAFTLAGLFGSWGLFRHRLLDIVPMARDAVIESMSDAVMVLDTQHRLVDLNPAAQEIVGRGDVEVIGQPIAEVLPLWPDLLKQYQAINETYSEITLDVGEEQRLFALTLSPLYDRLTHPTGSLIVLRDITEQKKAELELRKLSRAVEQSASTVVITDTDGNIEYVNPRFTELTGYSVDEAIGKNPRILKSGLTSAEEYRYLWETISCGGEWRGEFHNRKKNGELYWESASISPIKDSQGTTTHYLAVKEDITQRKQTEEALRQYMTELEARNAELDAFAHSVAHDLKTPLSVTVLYAGMLAASFETLTENKTRQHLQTIERSGRKMNNIINELLLLASVRKADVETEPLDMAHIVDEAQQRLVHVIEEQRADISVPETWPAALGHQAWVEEILVNYLSNALKYGGQPPHITLGATTLANGEIRFWVKDDGEGLTEEEQSQLFTPFTQISQARATGHGLGLSIVRRIVEKLGGQVGVESVKGQGSTFSFTLPAAPGPEA